MRGPRGLPSSPNILYHNLGSGKFENVSKSSGIEKTYGHYCLSVSPLDYNEDGWPDIYVACDSTASILYRNNKDGTFTDVGALAGVAYDEDGREQAGMGSTVGDYDNDGHQDIFKTNFSDDTSSLYHNEGDGTFAWRIVQAGLGLNTQYLGWGTMFLDVDNDGWLDILAVNGHVYPEVDTSRLGSTYKEPRILYWNEGNGKFKDVSKDSGPGCTEPESSRGMAIGDLWSDGRISVVVNNINSKPNLLVNLAESRNHWLGIRTVATKSNRDGIGARVLVFSGARKYVQEVRSGSSYISSNDLRLPSGSVRQERSIESKFTGQAAWQKASTGPPSTASSDWWRERENRSPIKIRFSGVRPGTHRSFSERDDQEISALLIFFHSSGVTDGGPTTSWIRRRVKRPGSFRSPAPGP
jgi:enediyne biosynthesis protein E4